MKKILFSLLALVAVTVGVSQAQQVSQWRTVHLGFTNSSAGGVEFYANCEVVFTQSGGQMIPTLIAYTTGAHARMMTGSELNLNVIVRETVTPLPDYDTATEVNYTWEWDLSKAGFGYPDMSGKGSGSARIKVQDIQYDPSLPNM